MKGDPHIYRFGQRHSYNLYASGEYWLLRSPVGLAAQVKTKPWGKKSGNAAFAMSAKGGLWGYTVRALRGV